MQFTTEHVTLESIIVGRNVRLPALMKIEELAADIHDNGLLTPISVYEVVGGFEVIQGHRRAAALARIYKAEPVHFASLFPNGVPVTVVTGITYEEAQVMKIDHGNEVSLADPMELQLCANLLFAQGKTEKDVVVRLAALMDRIKPMKADKAKKYTTMLADAELWKEKGNLTNAREKQAEAEKFLFEYRRGMVQNLHNAYRCPWIVMAALYFKATGEKAPENADFWFEGLDKEIIPAGVTYQHVNSLWKAFEKDLTIVKDGVMVHSKRNPGPDFLKKWSEVVSELTKKAEDSESATPRAKAMSAGEMETELKEGKWLSAFGQLLTRHHRKESGVDSTRLATLDKASLYAEILMAKAPEEWASSVKLAEAIIQENIEATKQVPEAQPEPKKAKKGRK
jgi:hypothetical protein